LIFVGILMLGNIREVDFSEMSNALPAFCTIVFMPFTYSIANGVAFGLITYCLMKLMTGRKQDVKALTLVISVVFVVRYAFMTLG
ncbi:MAG: NCS2 family permease, partial [Enterocloster citroniae]|nr:NCS2 family permease [Enterocloster citroniae]